MLPASSSIALDDQAIGFLCVYKVFLFVITFSCYLGCLVISFDIIKINFCIRFSRYDAFVLHVQAVCKICLNGDGEIRTLDPLLARQVLSQLSYAPMLVKVSSLACLFFSFISLFN